MIRRRQRKQKEVGKVVHWASNIHGGPACLLWYPRRVEPPGAGQISGSRTPEVGLPFAAVELTHPRASIAGRNREKHRLSHLSGR
jgi:hypothetical protein